MSIRKHVLLAVALLLCSPVLTHAQGSISGDPMGSVGTRLLPAAPFQSAMVGLAPRPYGAIRAAPVARHYAARTHRRIYRGGFQSAPVALNVAPIATVQPDNYRNWRQACCF